MIIWWKRRRNQITKQKNNMKKRKNPIYAYKRLLAKDYDWDYAYLIALEKKKLQRMHDCIKRENHLVNNAFSVVPPSKMPRHRATGTWRSMRQ